MRKTIMALVFLLVSFFNIPAGISQETCVNTEGEAAIVNNDIPSAKTEAVARAKWAAIEQTVGTEVKAQSLVQNFTLVDDAIKTKVRGVVKSYNVLDQVNKKDTVVVKIRACIEESKAK
ncbi:MAG: hypothetical protein NTX62_06140 [Deltaproteobacteria bacterium]|nr:hypothetical protein [Deltaproteobacteria bacterium]